MVERWMKGRHKFIALFLAMVCGFCVVDVQRAEGAPNEYPAAYVDENGYIVFPDENFTQALRVRNRLGDENGITPGQAAEATSLFLSNMNISSLNGIEYFTSLGFLDCSNNQLITIDVSQNIRLREFMCSDNQLSSLNISSNSLLVTLSCSSNQLTLLDISNNSALRELYCSNNLLTSLDVSKSPFWRLRCYENYIASVDDVIGWQNSFDTAGTKDDENNFNFYPQLEGAPPTPTPTPTPEPPAAPEIILPTFEIDDIEYLPEEGKIIVNFDQPMDTTQGNLEFNFPNYYGNPKGSFNEDGTIYTATYKYNDMYKNSSGSEAHQSYAHASSITVSSKGFITIGGVPVPDAEKTLPTIPKPMITGGSPLINSNVEIAAGNFSFFFNMPMDITVSSYVIICNANGIELQRLTGTWDTNGMAYTVTYTKLANENYKFYFYNFISVNGMPMRQRGDANYTAASILVTNVGNSADVYIGEYVESYDFTVNVPPSPISRTDPQNFEMNVRFDRNIIIYFPNASMN